MNPDTLAKEMQVKLSGQGSFHWPEVDCMATSSHSTVKVGLFSWVYDYPNQLCC